VQYLFHLDLSVDYHSRCRVACKTAIKQP